MSKAILTIDDIPQCVTKAMVDYLNEKEIPAIMFVVGENLEKDMETAVYAIQHGMILGNHSYSHPSFEELTFEAAVEEIEKTEQLLDQVYQKAGTERKVRLFRFPYLNKGGDKKEKLQSYLKERGYVGIDDSKVESKGYIEAGWNKDLDAACSYDCQEYMVPSGEKSFEDIMERIDEGDVGMGSNVLTDVGEHIILLHSHDDTERVENGYYKRILGYMLEKGVVFTQPKFK